MESRESVNIGDGSEATWVKADGEAGIIANAFVGPDAGIPPPTDPIPPQAGCRTAPSTKPTPATFENGSSSINLNGEDGLEVIIWASSSSHLVSSQGMALSRSNGTVARALVVMSGTTPSLEGINVDAFSDDEAWASEGGIEPTGTTFDEVGWINSALSLSGDQSHSLISNTSSTTLTVMLSLTIAASSSASLLDLALGPFFALDYQRCIAQSP